MPNIIAEKGSDIKNIPRNFVNDLKELRAIIESIEVATDQVLYYVSAAQGGVLTFTVLNMIAKDIPKFRIELDEQLKSKEYQMVGELLVDRREIAGTLIVTFRVR